MTEFESHSRECSERNDKCLSCGALICGYDRERHFAFHDRLDTVVTNLEQTALVLETLITSATTSPNWTWQSR